MRASAVPDSSPTQAGDVVSPSAPAPGDTEGTADASPLAPAQPPADSAQTLSPSDIATLASTLVARIDQPPASALDAGDTQPPPPEPATDHSVLASLTVDPHSPAKVKLEQEDPDALQPPQDTVGAPAEAESEQGAPSVHQPPHGLEGAQNPTEKARKSSKKGKRDKKTKREQEAPLAHQPSFVSEGTQVTTKGARVPTEKASRIKCPKKSGIVGLKVEPKASRTPSSSSSSSSSSRAPLPSAGTMVEVASSDAHRGSTRSTRVPWVEWSIRTPGGATADEFKYWLPCAHQPGMVAEYTQNGDDFILVRGGKGKGKGGGYGLTRIFAPVPGTNPPAIAIVVLARDLCAEFHVLGMCQRSGQVPGCRGYHFPVGSLVSALPSQNPQLLGMADATLENHHLIARFLERSDKQQAMHNDIRKQYVQNMQTKARRIHLDRMENRDMQKAVKAAQAAEEGDDLAEVNPLQATVDELRAKIAQLEQIQARNDQLLARYAQLEPGSLRRRSRSRSRSPRRSHNRRHSRSPRRSYSRRRSRSPSRYHQREYYHASPDRRRGASSSRHRRNSPERGRSGSPR